MDVPDAAPATGEAAGDDWRGYRHIALETGPDASAADQLLPVLRASLDRGDHLLLACSPHLAGRLRESLPAHAPVIVVDGATLDGRAPDALAHYTALLDQHAPAPGARVQLVTDGRRHDHGLHSWLETEALLNHVLADRPLDHVCVLDVETLAENVALARATHRLLLRDSQIVANPTWREPVEVLRELGRSRCRDPLEELPATLEMTDVDDMRSLRRQLTTSLAGGPLSEDDAEDLVLAIDEVTSNATEHGVPPVDVRLWVTPERVLCSITDRGAGFDEPLAGYGPAHGDDLSRGGMGLWLARRAVDRLTTDPLTPQGTGCVVGMVIDPRTRAGG